MNWGENYDVIIKINRCSIIQWPDKRSRRSWTTSTVAKHNINLPGWFQLKVWNESLMVCNFATTRGGTFISTRPSNSTSIERGIQAPGHIIGTVVQYSYFSVISRFPSRQWTIFEIFLQFSLPPPYTKLKLGKKFWIHASNIVCGVRGGVGPKWIGKRLRNTKVP